MALAPTNKALVAIKTIVSLRSRRSERLDGVVHVGVDAQLAGFAGKYREVSFAGENQLFGTDNINMNSEWHGFFPLRRVGRAAAKAPGTTPTLV